MFDRQPGPFPLASLKYVKGMSKLDGQISLGADLECESKNCTIDRRVSITPISRIESSF
jgi:hypothetical protein